MNRVSRRSEAQVAEALLEAGRSEPVLHYDVELGLARHQDWMRHEAPMPEWASAPVPTASTSFLGIVIKTIASAVLLGALATAAWQARDLLQPAAAKVEPAAPGIAAKQPAATDIEAEAAAAPIPVPLPDQAAAREHAVRRAVRADASDKRATRLHREHKARPAVPAVTGPARAQIAATPVSTTSTDEHAPRPAARPEPDRNPTEVEEPQPERARKPQQPEDLIEMQQVATAEQLLERSPARALALVRKGDQRFARGYFQQERAYIAIMALIRLGRTDEARARAASFSKLFPELPYGARIRAALDAVARDAAP